MIKPGENSGAMVINTDTASILQAIFGCSGKKVAEPARGQDSSKTASVKFMITLKDESDLRDLGYSQPRIDKMKPEEAGDIIKSGRRAEEE